MAYDKMRLTSLIVMVFVLSSCGDTKEDVNFFHKNVKSFDSLRTLLESRYGYRLTDTISSRHRIVFVDCALEGNLSDLDYVCDDKEVIEWMRKMHVREIMFEESMRECVLNFKFNELRILRRSSILEPGVYFVYEYCGTSVASRSRTFE
jgi:hypothetical protein